jgi:RNA polymerase sigma factor (sigma-70 family)
VRESSLTWWDTRVSDTTADFTRFFEVEFQSVVRTAYFILHDRQSAEDIAQDAFAQLYLHWKKVAAYERPDAWVRRVAIRMAVRAAGREHRRRDLERDVAPSAVANPRDFDLVRAVRQLPPQQRAAVALFYFEDRPLAEIAHILDCAEPTARVHLVKARRRLGELLGEEVLDADGP